MFRQRSLGFLVVVPVLILVLLLLSLGPKPDAQAAFGDRITVSGSQFVAGGQRIWINGANTPWNNWNDFGGNYNASWWDSHFQQLHDAGINATRVWITCSGEVGINISDAGFVSGATDKHWQDLDSFFQIAQQRQIYVMATLISFDHFKNTYSTYPRWRNMIQSNANIDSYVNNYVIPFVNRYESNPYVWSIDLINEPDWVHENAEVGQFAWDPLQEYWARAARAIHENSPVLVTVGMGMPKYQSGSCSGCEGNVIADSALRAKVNDPDVYIDFYSSHYYPWQDPYFGGIPFYKSPTAYYGADPGKPSMIGETPATGSTGHTLTQDYENAYLNGWQGVMPWTSNGVDSNGGFAQVSPATDAFRDNHPSLVFPGGTPPPTTPPPTTPPPTTPPPTTPPPTTPPPTTPPPTTPPPSGNTGWVSPTAQAAQSGGDGNGFQTSPASAFADDSAFATDTNSGNGTSTSCTSTNKDRHAYYSYPISIPAGATVNGIEVRLDSRADSTSGSPRHCVDLSWNNGSSWTSAKQTGTLTTSMATRTLGSASDNWGRTWTTGELTSANLRVRIVNVASSTSRDFYLDWVAVRVTYSGATPPPTTPPPTGAGITTGQARNIAADRAVLNSTSTITGNPQQVVVSYAYWETSNPAVVTTVTGQTYSGVGNFYDEVLVTGLKAATQYTYHAIGQFMFEGTMTAPDVTFMTTAPPTTPPPTTPPPGGACSPVTSTIAAPFTFDGAGTFCWQTSNLGSFINSWNLASLTINGVDFTNRWAGSGSYPPPINGFWYVSYTGSFPWSHFEAK